MRQRGWVVWTFAVLCSSSLHAQSVCATCHPREWNTYRLTGMGRSFYKPQASNKVEDYTRKNTYYHKASDTYYEMVDRGGKFFQRQYQIDFDGKQTNILEKQIDYIVGSGNHSRTYLTRAANSTLFELPLAWYAEKGGYWAMNPGYDSPDHPGFRRRIEPDCLFCHNAYPEVGGNVPEGIDCQRCHGSGEAHVKLAQSKTAPLSAVREAIVNPARLPPERQMEVCMQCHLETTSFPLPNSIVRYEKGPFSWKPGEPLADFKLFFDSATRADTFEIASAAYRLRKSACLLQSNGRLTCTTCHDPHGFKQYTAVCRECHAAKIAQLIASNRHTAAADCTGCHMPKRRTDDVVHVVMTDHYIQRRKPTGDLVADIPESRHEYHGDVALYYPAALPEPEDELYLATAQVLSGANLSAGIPRLAAAIEKYRPEDADHYLQLADAFRNNGQCGHAIPMYEEALRRNPRFISAMQKTALCFESSGQHAKAVGILNRALELAPDNANTWTQLGLAYIGQQKTAEGIAAFQKAIAIDPEMPEAWNDLGGVWLVTDPAKAEPALRNAIRFQTNYAEAHNNLGSLLSNAGRFDEARYHFEAALRYKTDYNFARFNYALALARVRRFDEAQIQFEAILRTDNKAVEAHEALGLMLSDNGHPEQAILHFKEAVRIRPDFDRANLSLGEALMNTGDAAAALPYLRKAAQSKDKAIREQSEKLLTEVIR